MVGLSVEKISDQIYNIIKERIITNKLKPGCRFNFEDLQSEFKISKTPLREALNKLEIEGFIEIRPRSGTYVKIPGEKDIIDIYDLRKAIEWQTLQLAATNIPESKLLNLQRDNNIAYTLVEKGDFSYFLECDTNFHSTLLNYCDNNRIKSVADTIDGHMKWFRFYSASSIEKTSRACQRHLQIIDLLLKKSVIEAADLLVLHIDEVKNDVIREYQRNSNQGLKETK